MGRVQKWFGPLSGVVFVGAVVAGGGVFGGVDAAPSDSVGQVLGEFREKADEIQTASLLTMLGVGFLLVFLGHLRTKFREGGAGWAADGFLAGGVALAGAWVALVGVQLAGGVAGAYGHSEVAQSAVDFLWEGSYLFTPGLVAVGVSAAAASFTHKVLPSWLGVVAVLVALGSLAPWMGILFFIAWVLAAVIVESIRVIRPVSVVEVR